MSGRRLRGTRSPNAAAYTVAGMAGVAGSAALISGGYLAAALSGVLAVAVLSIATRVQFDLPKLVVLGVVIMLVVPARNRVGALGAAGTVGALLGLAAFAAFALGWFGNRAWLARGRQPLHRACAILAVSVLISYLFSAFRVRPPTEVKAADRGIMLLMIIVGVMLIVADGLRTRTDIDNVVKGIVGGGTVAALFGLLQFVTETDYAARLKIPGMIFVDAGYATDRSGFSRIVGTVSHPIELSVALVMCLILALHLSFTQPRETRQPWVLCAVVLGVAVPLTVSRTAVIALVVAALVLFPSWDRNRRANMAVLGIVGLVVMRLIVPGLLGTLLAFFTNSSNDPSRLSRVAGFDFAVRLVQQRPVFGRGLTTYIPGNYLYLDDQILLTVVEIGFVGLAAILLLFWVGIGLTRDVRRSAYLRADRELAQALFACMLVALVSAFTFDEFSFPTVTALLMVVFGLAAAHWRIVTFAEQPPRLRRNRRPSPRKVAEANVA